ncbi:MAG: hypothetical protein QCI38_05885, partial [Candidatus Thermoplasmatota archaeon]|nr:hypothetical protein [Candidatus Thermoplasmatota archaeon]
KVAPSFAGLQSVVDRQRGGQLLLSWNDATDTTTAPGVQSDITYRIYRDTTENVRVEPTYLWQTVTTTTFLDTGLTNGQTYWYIVKAVDGAGNVDGARIVRLSGIPTRENTAPSLAPEALGFSPANKIGATQVTFRVLYTDVDGDKPDYVRVVVESSSGVNEWSMEATDAGASPDYVNGVIYQRIQTIEPGDYKYYFKCRDSPGAASFEGPKPYATSPKEDIKIFSRNTAPVLREMAVTPTFGDVKTEFSFTAIYTDADGDVPVNMRVVINNQPYDMVMITGGADYTQPSTWSFSTTLEKGTHTYYFFVSDGQGNSYTSSTRNLEVVDAEVEERGGDFLTNFLNDEYYGLTGFVWLVLLIILIIGIIAVASMAGGKKQSPPKKGAEGEQAPAPGETISCPTCNSKLLVNTTERPVTVECPSCHSQLKVS